LLPVSFLIASGSIHSGWTGFRISIPISIRSGINTLDIAVGVIIADYPGIDLLGRLENIDKRSSVHGYVVLPLKLGDLLLNALPPVVGQDIGQGEAPNLFGRFESLHREDHAPEVVTASMEVSCSDEPRGGCDLICNEHGQKDRAWLNSTIS